MTTEIKTETYTIRTLKDGDAIGETILTDEQYRRYEQRVQPCGGIYLFDVPGHVELSVTMDGSTPVWLD